MNKTINKYLKDNTIKQAKIDIDDDVYYIEREK